VIVATATNPCAPGAAWLAALVRPGQAHDWAGGAHEGGRFSRKAAIPSAASAEANSDWDSSLVRVNAALRSIPGIV